MDAARDYHNKWNKSERQIPYGITYVCVCMCACMRVCACVCVCVLIYVQLCDLMNFNPPGSSVHGISQARILEWVAISSSRGFSPPRDQTHISCIFVHWQEDSLPLSHMGSPWYHIYVESKIWHKWIYLWNGITHIENRLVVAKGEGLREGWSGRLGLADVSFLYGMDKPQGPTIAQRTIFKTLW